MKKFKLSTIVTIALLIGITIGILVGRYQADKHNPFLTHWTLENEGYNYFPYCGENLYSQPIWAEKDLVVSESED